MLIGFGLPVAGSWATPQNQLELARRAEELGYATLWTFHRLLFPAGAGGSGGPWGDVYRSVLDPVVSLAHVASATTRIRLGAAIVNAPFVAPVVLAKQISTLDVLSGGRVELGLGQGWVPEEFTATGVPMQRRGARIEEYVGVLDRVWSGDTQAAWSGEFYQLPAASFAPRPVQRPRPPLLLGAGAEAALRRAGRIADGWVSASRAPLPRIGAMVRVVRDAAEQVGRDPASLRCVCRGAVRLRESATGAAAGDERPMLTGELEQIGEDLARLATQGLSETFLDLNFDPEVAAPGADAARSMDRARRLLEAFAPQRG